MGPIGACVGSFLWDADSRIPVTVFLELPTVAVSFVILIWFGFSVLNFHVDIIIQRIYAVIMVIELGRRSNWFFLMVLFAERGRRRVYCCQLRLNFDPSVA